MRFPYWGRYARMGTGEYCKYISQLFYMKYNTLLKVSRHNTTIFTVSIKFHHNLEYNVIIVSHIVPIIFRCPHFGDIMLCRTCCAIWSMLRVLMTLFPRYDITPHKITLFTYSQVCCDVANNCKLIYLILQSKVIAITLFVCLSVCLFICFLCVRHTMQYMEHYTERNITRNGRGGGGGRGVGKGVGRT